MQISSSLPMNSQPMMSEVGEAPEARPDNEAIEKAPAKAPLASYQGQNVDVSA